MLSLAITESCLQIEQLSLDLVDLRQRHLPVPVVVIQGETPEKTDRRRRSICPGYQPLRHQTFL